MTPREGCIGRDAFAYLHDFHWEDHKWQIRVPKQSQLEIYEAIVWREHRELLKPGIGNIGSP